MAEWKFVFFLGHCLTLAPCFITPPTHSLTMWFVLLLQGRRSRSDQSGYGLTTVHMLTISLLAAVASLHRISKCYILANHPAYSLATLTS